MDDLDSTVKNVVQELSRECTNHAIPVSENFLIYYVELLILNPSWGIFSGILPNRNDVQYFVKDCLKKLNTQSHSYIVILKMQLYFQDHFENLHNLVIKNRVDLKSRLEPLEKEVIETTLAIDKTELDKLHQKIVYLITLYAGLGNPTNDKVYKEASAALKSVLFESDLKEFILDTYENKESQLVELTELVTGIRLFNRDSKKGGAGIEDLTKILPHAIEVTLQDVEKTIGSIMETVNFLTTAIDNSYKMENKGETYTLQLHLPDEVNEAQFRHAMNVLIIYRQYELFIRKIFVEVHRIDETTKLTILRLKKSLEDVHQTVQMKVAIPTRQVFPLFSQVARIWCQLQDQAIALAQLNHILLTLEVEVRKAVFHPEIIKLILGPSAIVSDAERLEKTANKKIEGTKDVLILPPTQIGHFDQTKLEYLGFCPWKFIETQGALIPANPNMGVASISGKYYAFSCPEAAEAFFKIRLGKYKDARCKQPNTLRGLEIVRHRCELIHFFQMKEQLVQVAKIEKLVMEIPQLTLTFNAEVQTELHPIPTHIDPNYNSNIWDWKRKAILFADISRRVTKSTQTHKSRARGAVAVQTHNLKDVQQQTKKDNYTTTPTVSNFIYGLRGTTNDKQHVITLTRPNTE